MGIILCEIVSRRLPYSEHSISKSNFVSQFEDAIIKGLRPTIPNDCPPQLTQLIQKCWVDSPEERPSFEIIYNELAGMLKTGGVAVKTTTVPRAPGVPPRPISVRPASSNTIVGRMGSALENSNNITSTHMSPNSRPGSMRGPLSTTLRPKSNVATTVNDNNNKVSKDTQDIPTSPPAATAMSPPPTTNTITTPGSVAASRASMLFTYTFISFKK